MKNPSGATALLAVRALAFALIVTLPTAAARAAEPLAITVHVDKSGAKINPGFYGLMTEEINHSYDGGLYGELLQNRAFKDDATRPVHWSLVQTGTGTGTIELDRTNPRDPALDTSLKLNVSTAGARVGAANDGFWGIPVRPGTAYQVTFYARAAAASAGAAAPPLTVDLESADGQTIHASATLTGLTQDWRKFTATLRTGTGITASAANRFVISIDQPGTVWLGYVSLFPPTYKDRTNGNRPDLMEKLAALQPAFLRFPGGNYVDPGHYQWKKTLGPVESRPGSPGAWHYHISEGLGLLEFFLWCEDLHMEPLLAVTDGRSWLPADGDVAPLVQDALDEIEYATGGPATTWGARRVADGHPAPFTLRYVEIGNEDTFDKLPTYDARFAKFFDAIRAKYPQLQIIATRPDIKSRVPDLIDDHIYASATRMLRASQNYDKRPRTGPKIFVGEWATNGDGIPTPTLRAALGDAAYLTGLERNADIVTMACYAPLLVNVNPGARQWPTNLIGYDAVTSFGSPSYYMQTMFSQNRGSTVLPIEVTGAIDVKPAAPEPAHGGVGLGTWVTQAEFSDFSVTAPDGKPLPLPDFSQWQRHGGEWTSNHGAFVQSTTLTRVWTTAGDRAWTDYTIKVKARRTGGKEGFLVVFHVVDKDNLVWWNVGGWGNTAAGIEQTVDGDRSVAGDKKQPFTVETGRDYQLEVEVRGNHARCSVDGRVLTEADIVPPAPITLPIFASASRDGASGEVILKVVNASASAQPVRIALNGANKIGSTAKGQWLAGQPGDVNSVEEPEKIAPQPLAITGVAKSFTHEFPANSVSVFRVKAD